MQIFYTKLFFAFMVIFYEHITILLQLQLLYVFNKKEKFIC
jgi:hypothetical protein